MKYLLAVIIIASIGCVKDGIQTSKTNNSQIEVQLLFEHDGCKVYRFIDEDRRYFTNCKGSTSWSEYCGKNCVKEQGVSGK